MTISDEAAWQGLMDALPRRLAGATDALPVRQLEATLEASYPLADAHGEGRLDQLHALLRGCVPGSRAAQLILAPWRHLVELRLACLRGTASRDDDLDAGIRLAPPRTRWLVGAERARLLRQTVGAEVAWQRLALHPPVPAEESWQDQSPMVLHAILVGLHLAAETGRWDERDAFLFDARRRWPDGRDRAVLRVELLAADHEVRRGHYVRALASLDALEGLVVGDFRLSLLCTRLHAQVACASSYQHDLVGSRRVTTEAPDLVGAIDQTLRALAVAVRGEGDPIGSSPEQRLPAAERAVIIQKCAALEHHVRGGRPSDADAQIGAKDEAAPSVAGLLAGEHAIRILPAGESRVRALASLRDAAHAFASRYEPTGEEERMLLSLLLCRLAIDLADVDVFEDCSDILSHVIDDAQRLGLPRVVMAALDQRAVLLAHADGRWAPDWHAAVADAGRAANIAVQLIADNVRPEGEPGQIVAGHLVMARALLRSLLPVLDRAVTLLADGATALLRGVSSDRATWDRSLRNRWGRFGRAIHDYVEQAQFLALEESRRAHGTGATRPNRFHLVSLGEPSPVGEDPIRAIQEQLGRRDLILQYYVAGPTVIVFLIGRASFEWALGAVTQGRPDGTHDRLPVPAHASLAHLVDKCRTWIDGNSMDVAVEASVDAL